MSFREKTAWVTLISILLVFALYFLHVPRLFNPNPGLWSLHALLASTACFIVIEVLGLLVLRWRNPVDARTPKDERERLIDLKATRLAARCYVVLTFLAILTPHHGANGFAVGVFVLMAFTIAQVVNYGARIFYYRRGA
jgi:heme/copper-type cytochrome/quinol oxidase subunit 4